MRSFPYLLDVLFIFSMEFLISSQSSVYFVNTSLFLSIETTHELHDFPRWQTVADVNQSIL